MTYGILKASILENLKIEDKNMVLYLIDPLSKCWRVGVISMCFPSWIRNEILSLPISKASYVDKLVWPYMDNGKFTLKSSYKLLHGILVAFGNSL